MSPLTGILQFSLEATHGGEWQVHPLGELVGTVVPSVCIYKQVSLSIYLSQRGVMNERESNQGRGEIARKDWKSKKETKILSEFSRGIVI
jgi:hypothetical protein